MRTTFVKLAALAALSALILPGVAAAQRRPLRPPVIQQRYGVGTYDGRFLHPAGRAATAVPIDLEDGRTGELLIPANDRDRHAMYFRDDETGEILPVQLDSRATRADVLRQPRVMGVQRSRRAGQPSWEQDALIIGGGAAVGALIGAAAGGGKGAAVGAAAGGIGGLIFDLLSQDRQAPPPPPRPPRRR